MRPWWDKYLCRANFLISHGKNLSEGQKETVVLVTYPLINPTFVLFIDTRVNLLQTDMTNTNEKTSVGNVHGVESF